MSLDNLLNKVESLELNEVETRAYNYLIEELEGLTFVGHCGERLRELCVMILENKIASQR